MWLGILSFNNFYDIAVMQDAVEWSNLAIHFGANTFVTKCSVYLVSKVDRCRFARKVFDISLRSKNENSVFEQIHLQ